VVSKKTPDEQVRTLVFSLTDGLKDAHAQSSSGACAILNCLMKFRGGELNKEVSSFLIQIFKMNLVCLNYMDVINTKVFH